MTKNKTILEQLEEGLLKDETEPCTILYLSPHKDQGYRIKTFYNLSDQTAWLGAVVIGLANLAMNHPMTVTESYLKFLKDNPEQDPDKDQSTDDLPAWAKKTEGKPN